MRKVAAKEVFEEKPANTASLSQRKKVRGIGINDSTYITNYISESGRTLHCPYYVKWVDMFKRCYSDIYHKKQPTYKDCSVSEDWILFSNFKEWMKSQDWKGKQLDKDLLFLGNKVYSPDTCVFIDSKVNSLLSDNRATRGKHAQGVCFCKSKQKYKASCSFGGNPKHLGYFTTEDAAESEYKRCKVMYILEVAEEVYDPRVKQVLKDIAKSY